MDGWMEHIECEKIFIWNSLLISFSSYPIPSHFIVHTQYYCGVYCIQHIQCYVLCTFFSFLYTCRCFFFSPFYICSFQHFYGWVFVAVVVVVVFSAVVISRRNSSLKWCHHCYSYLKSKHFSLSLSLSLPLCHALFVPCACVCLLSRLFGSISIIVIVTDKSNSSRVIKYKKRKPIHTQEDHTALGYGFVLMCSVQCVQSRHSPYILCVFLVYSVFFFVLFLFLFVYIHLCDDTFIPSWFCVYKRALFFFIALKFICWARHFLLLLFVCYCYTLWFSPLTQCVYRWFNV